MVQNYLDNYHSNSNEHLLLNKKLGPWKVVLFERLFLWNQSHRLKYEVKKSKLFYLRIIYFIFKAESRGIIIEKWD